jgi:hypothetical protein
MSRHTVIVSAIPGCTIAVVLTRLVMAPAAFGGGGS